MCILEEKKFARWSRVYVTLLGHLTASTFPEYCEEWSEIILYVGENVSEHWQYSEWHNPEWNNHKQHIPKQLNTERSKILNATYIILYETYIILNATYIYMYYIILYETSFGQINLKICSHCFIPKIHNVNDFHRFRACFFLFIASSFSCQVKWN